jgi:hypothetical protein
MREKLRHAGLAREIAQHHRLAASCKRAEQFSADLDRLDAAALSFHAPPGVAYAALRLAALSAR